MDFLENQIKNKFSEYLNTSEIDYVKCNEQYYDLVRDKNSVTIVTIYLKRKGWKRVNLFEEAGRIFTKIQTPLGKSALIKRVYCWGYSNPKSIELHFNHSELLDFLGISRVIKDVVGGDIEDD